MPESKNSRSKTPAKADRELAAVQSESIDKDIKKSSYRYDDENNAFLDVKGTEFKLAEDLPLMVAAKLSLMQDDESEMDLETLYLLLQALINGSDWKKFERFSIQKNLDAEDLVGVIAGALEAITGRPTVEPSGS